MYIYFCDQRHIATVHLPFVVPARKDIQLYLQRNLGGTSNINNNLLRQLSETVPGTFQHSLQVANLAAEAAIRIGAKASWYVPEPSTMISERWRTPFSLREPIGRHQPARKLSYEQSAINCNQPRNRWSCRPRKHNPPKVIKDFITTHHGKGKTKFFSHFMENEHPDEEPG